MDMAEAIARRSTCERAHHGAVIVDPQNRVVSTGYNGSPPGRPHCEDVGCEIEYTQPDGEFGAGQYGTPHCVRTLHAETNAIIHAKTDLAGYTIYVTGSPCPKCRREIAAAGITRISYREDGSVHDEFNESQGCCGCGRSTCGDWPACIGVRASVGRLNETDADYDGTISDVHITRPADSVDRGADESGDHLDSGDGNTSDEYPCLYCHATAKFYAAADCNVCDYPFRCTNCNGCPYGHSPAAAFYGYRTLGSTGPAG